jgi:hypothetical protein
MPKHPRVADRRPLLGGEIDRRALMPLLGAGAAFMLARSAQAQQIEVPKPVRGTALTIEYGHSRPVEPTASRAMSAMPR